jgi:hypothetical protein
MPAESTLKFSSQASAVGHRLWKTLARHFDFFAANRQLPMTFWTRKATTKNLRRNNLGPLAAG